MQGPTAETPVGSFRRSAVNCFGNPKYLKTHDVVLNIKK